MELIINARDGITLQTIFTAGVRTQISENHEDFKNIKSFKIGKNTAREINFLFKTSLGAAAVQNASQMDNTPFNQGQNARKNEYSAKLKKAQVTLEVNYDVFKRAQEAKSNSYFQPLVDEIENKKIVAQQIECLQLHMDGTGVLGTVASISEANIAAGEVTITLNATSTARGSVTLFLSEDYIQAFTPNAVTDRLLAASVANMQVIATDRAANTVTLQLLDASGQVLTSVVSTGIAAGDVLYRNKNAVNLTAPISDYNDASFDWAGLESLAAADGRVVHGITMSGPTAASRYNGAAAALDPSFISKALDTAKLRAGESPYEYSQMLLCPEAHSKITNDREALRQFTTANDNQKGGPVFKYLHRNSALSAVVSEYVRKDRIWMIPQSKANGQKVLELHGTDYQTVSGSQTSTEFMLKTGANGYTNMVQSFLTSYRTVICKHPAAIAVVENFTI